MKKFQIILMAVLLAAGAGYSAVITNLVVDFTGQTAGNQPTGALLVVPATGNTTTNFVKVVSSSTIGSGNAVNVYDNSSVGAAGLYYNFVSDANHQEGAVGVKFTYTQRSTQTAIGAGNLSVQVGEYAVANTNGVASGRTSIAEVQFGNAGKVRSVFGNSPSNMVNDGVYAAGSVHTVEFFANDLNSSTVNYVMNGTTYALNANSYSIWIDGANLGGGTAGLLFNTAWFVDGTTTNTPPADQRTVGNTEWNLGSFSITTQGGQGGDDYDFDNIQVTALIPEPATMGMLLLGAVTVLAVRRRRA